MEARPSKSVPLRVLAIAGASLLAAAMALYSGVWMYAASHSTVPVEVGCEFNFTGPDQPLVVGRVDPDGPAEKAGLRRGDRLVAVNGEKLMTRTPFVVNDVWWNGRPGEGVELTVERPGEERPLILHVTLGEPAPPGPRDGGILKLSTRQILRSYPLWFLLVGVTVLFLRLEDRNAWLLALVFAGFIAGAPLFFLNAVRPDLRAFALAYRALFYAFLMPLFYFFFAVFPARAFIDMRVPWLKWAGLVCSAIVALPGLGAGEPFFPKFLTQWTGITTGPFMEVYGYGFMALGLVALATNAFRQPSMEARRKARVILWGTFVGVVPVVSERAAMNFFGFRPPFWLDTSLVLILFLFPLSFAYGVLKHRVLEIPALLKRSARYVLVRRGFVLLSVVAGAAAVLAFDLLFSLLFPRGSQSVISLVCGVGFGAVLAAVSQQSFKQGSRRIDRAFFRSDYDARVILQDLASNTRTVGDRHELAALLEKHIQDALHPKSVTGYLDVGDGILAREFGSVPRELPAAPASLPALIELARRGKSWEVPPLESVSLGPLSVLKPEILVPILGRDSRLIGLVVLGERLSEEPYSGEDKNLLDSVASQAGIALENIRLAESIAERMEAERGAARDLEIAREVQARLFPQKSPPLRTLEYAGACIQARRVGGDYYDFLDLGVGRLGIVLADISGKGISAALLMANLQANLRSQYALALEDLPRLLQSVNQLFHQNSQPASYATLFFGDYSDAQRRLRYVNCGHNPPIVIRRDGAVERLAATATVIGLFPEWQCAVAETTLDPGDLIVMYTDGVTEAPDDSGEEFGETRLIEALQSNARIPVDGLLTRIQTAVLQFGGEAQADDLTLVIGRAR